MFDNFLATVLPVALELAATVLVLAMTAAIAYVTRAAKERLNVEIDQTLMKRMHSALETAVAGLIARVGIDAALEVIERPEVRRDLFREAMQSSPDAISAVVKGAEAIAAAASPLPDPIDRLLFRFAQDRVAKLRGALGR